MKTKICSKCQQLKLLNKFSFHKNGKNHKASWCKECAKEYCLKHKEELKIKAKKYKEKHKKQIKIHQSDYYLKNKSKIAIQVKNYQEDHKEQLIIRRKNYYLKNKDKILLQRKRYCEKHKAEIAVRNNKYRFKRRKTDIRYKIACNLRTRIKHAIKGNTKSLSTMFLIGCEVDYLMYHLQSRFQPGMSWDNHREWHIDHRKPCNAFDLYKQSEQQKCFHYSNLQPLWAKDNLNKSDKWDLFEIKEIN